MKTMMTATTSMVSRRRRRGIPPGRASGLAPRSIIIVFAPSLRVAATLGEQRRREDDEGGEFPGPQVAKRNLERLSL